MKPLKAPLSYPIPISPMLFVWLAACLICIACPLTTIAQKNYTVANGANLTIDPFPVTGCTPTWKNDQPAIGLATSGLNDIPTFKAINNGVTPIVAKITVGTVSIPPKGYGAANGGVAKLNLATLEVEAMVPVPNGVFLGISPDKNEIYVFDSQDKRKLYIVSTAGNQVLATVNVGTNLPADETGMMMTPDGSKLYFFSSYVNPQTMSYVDIKARTTQTFILPTTVTRNQYASMSPDGNRIYISCDANIHQILVFDTNSNTFRTPINMIRPGAIMAADGNNKLYIINGDGGRMYAYNINSGAFTELPVGKGPKFMTPTPERRYIYLTEYDNPKSAINTYIIDSFNDNITRVAFSAGIRPAFTDDGKYLYLPEGSNILVIDRATNKVITTISANRASPNTFSAYPQRPQLNYDGSKLYIPYKVESSVTNPAEFNYVAVISTVTNKMIDSIPSGAVAIARVTSAGACESTPYTFTITVNPDPPMVTAGTVPAMNTVYGTASQGTPFNLSGTKINGSITATAPEGFEISKDNQTFSASVRADATANNVSTTLYLRLKATADAMTYQSNVTLSTTGAADVLIPITASVVHPATVLLKPDNQTKIYGASLQKSTGFKKFTATGLKNGDEIGSVTVAYKSGAAATDPVKVYAGAVSVANPIGGTFKASNYIFDSPTSDLTIEPAQLIITADDKRKIEGEDNPTLTFTYSGFVNGEGPSVLTIQPTISTSVTRFTTADLYPIIISGALANNYTITYVAGSFTVEPKVLTMPSAFTPNGDGINDTWQIKFIYLYPKCTMDIFTRDGQKLFHSIGYSTAWDGKYSGTDVAAGTYYYVVNLNNGKKSITGNLTIIR